MDGSHGAKKWGGMGGGIKHEEAGKVWVGTSVSKMARKLWVCLVNEKERKVCLLGGRPWSGSNVQEGLASCMKRRARCVYGWKALEWECGGGWVGRVNKKARKVCVGRGPWSGSAVKDVLAHKMGRRGSCM